MAFTAQELAEMRLCVDAVVPEKHQADAAGLALEESDRNAPDQGLLAGLLARGIEHPQAQVMLRGKKWQNGRTLPVYFIDGPEWARESVFYWLKMWTRQANLHMVRTNDRSAAATRITLERGPSWSYLGTDNLAIPVDEPTMQLGWLLDVPNDEREWNRTVVHEGGHWLNFGHEQSHPQRTFEFNREAVIAAYSGPPNNWSVREIEQQVLFRYTTLQTNFTAYDPHSIMHYALPARLLVDPADAVGWNNERSLADKRAAALWYPRPSLDVLLRSVVEATERGLG